MKSSHTLPKSRALLVFVLLVPVLAQLCQIPCRGIDPDELEHLHAAYCVHLGLVPYRDFFEHHAPALYYLLQPLFWWHGDDLSVLWCGRLLMWVCSCGTLVFTGLAARRVAGRTAGLIAPALLAWTSIYFAKGIELRPDVPATLLFTLALWHCSKQNADSSWCRWLILGFLLGLATLFTQKAIIPSVGLALGAGFQRARIGPLTRQHRECEVGLTYLVIPACCIAVAAGAPWLTAIMMFAAIGAGHDFFNGTVVRLWHWPIPTLSIDHFWLALVSDLTVWCVGYLGFSVCAWRVYRKRPRCYPSSELFAGIVVLAGIYGTLRAVAIFPQYFLLWYPAFCVVAAKWLRICSRLPAPRIQFPLITAGLFGLSATNGFLALRAMKRGRDGALTHLFEHLPAPIAETVNWLLLLALILMAAVMIYSRRPRNAWVCLAILGLWYAGMRNLDLMLWSNREQVTAIDTVNKHVPADGTVFDGFVGYGALRRHAWYYWWLNEYSLALIPRGELENDLPKLLKNSPPDVILLDENLQRLPGGTAEWIRDNYRPDALSPIWVRRKVE